ncbi:type II CRISPR-associated endonuclease Cas1 [Corynebacterium sp. 153RC1]|uniref:type II CRISPR-associated endonuclease Cas1 n=1 Tax=unclassified Corynebacterium TaxID=2624378 RepID=UPI00211C3978|nr:MULTISPECIES: type II CRISPR-associated endonuclease Cas1 [unclassified Corynebacterium]MCQ9352687.1 type II CRISPR-associated endonuclease Cas1 [Corynebacterium sp. 209RC1]MCQ9354871.1 type II CRISPR-associated endonuclease Cas1 [Corynebacterium sp. 1222RC1]MCQ9357056.1 type II CRISPR-associated endonuclease Cas1 [Corynebacterium sp. 122RC1]MCQ9359302.1 type II CRISPR-associated endonuclease Cas1 [Corynebacterium sp. 142RC1]MCQ9361524.1 type II CRISPR-associated endonuclease Cas1 [Coryneba
MENVGWRVLDFLEFEGDIGYSRGQIQITSGDGSVNQRIPLAGIAVILVGVMVKISGAAIAKLSEYDIAILVCDWRSVPVAAVEPNGVHGRIGARHRAQAALTEPRRKQAWKALVQAKVRGQAINLEKMGFLFQSEKLFELAKSVRSGDSTNIEALAARIYWQTVGHEVGFTRLPGGSPDGWNSALDYGYTILRGHGIRAVAAAGLCAPIGLFHRGRANPNNLVDDLIEPFRPAVDAIVFRNIPFGETLSKQSKSYFGALGEHPFTDSGFTIPTLLQDLAQDLGRYVEGELSKLVAPVWAGGGFAEEG